MKKTLTVNISGIVFHIDEDAFNVLHNYLQSIKKHFARTEGGDEIVSDIEARIAEMLKERIGDERQVITIDDIEEVINVIGQPSEFGEEFAEDADSRKSYEENTSKRLYRDPENSILGGVCGGMGAYFRTDPVWFRIAFVLLCLPGIGSPFLIYVILWIVIPEAKTVAERLEMKGEKVNISNIESSIREEISNLKNKFNEFTREAKQGYKKKSATYRSDFEGVGGALGKVAELFVKVVLVFAGIILFIVGLSVIIALLAALFGLGHDIFIVDSELIYISFPALVNFFIGSMGSGVLFKIAFTLLIGLPVLMILYAGVKLIFGLQRTRYVGLTVFNIWLVALFVSGFYAFKIFRSFSHTGIHEDKAKVEAPANDLLILKMNENKKFNRYYRYEEYFEIDETNMIITNDQYDFYYGIPRVEIDKSNTQDIKVEFYYKAKGKSTLAAEHRASQTIYNYTVKGSEIKLDQFFKLPRHEVWRNQAIDIVVKVPVGNKVFISDNMHFIINDFYHSPYRLSGETWLMTESGLEETEDVIPEPSIEEEPETETPEGPTAISQKKNKSQIVIGFIYEKFLGIFGRAA